MKMAAREYGFALAGCGQVSRKHAAAVAAAEDAALVAVCDPAAGRMEPYVQQHGAKGYTDYRRLLEDPRVEVVCLAVPSGLHVSMGREAARAGKHLLVEKPLALTLAEADTLIAEARAAGVKLAVVHPNRFKPGVALLKETLEQGAFGRLTHAAATVRWNRNDHYYAEAPWRGRKDADGGVLLNQALHNIDLLQWLAGPVEEVFAYTTRRLRPIETEDVGVAVLKLAGGALGTVEAAVTLYPENLEETLAVFGEYGTAVLDGTSVGRLRTWRVRGWDERSARELCERINAGPEGKPGHQVMVEGMVRALREGGEPPVTGEDGRQSLEIILALYRSAETGRPVRLPLTED